MAHVLIVILSLYDGATMFSHDFRSLEHCEAAKQDILKKHKEQKLEGKVMATCVVQ